MPAGEPVWGPSASPPVVTAAASGSSAPEQPAALAVAPDARSVVLATSERLVRYVTEREKRADCPLPASESLMPPCARTTVAGALAVNWSGDGRYVVAALRDGTVRWYTATDLTEQLALYLHPDGKRWALWRPDGRYAASVGGDELVGYHVNPPRGKAATLFPLARLRPSRERPAEVAAALRGPASPAVPPVALRQVLPPTVTVTAPTDGAAVSSPQVVVHVSLGLPAGQEVSGLRVLVDGRLTAKLSGEGGRERDLTVTIPPRDCTVAVIAQSAAGSSTPASLRLRWTGPPPPPAASPELAARLLILAVGVGAYNRPDLRLTYPAKDARDLAQLKRWRDAPALVVDNVGPSIRPKARQELETLLMWALDRRRRRSGQFRQSVGPGELRHVVWPARRGL